jgi:hypothetical protein
MAWRRHRCRHARAHDPARRPGSGRRGQLQWRAHTPALSNGTVSPGSGTTSTNFAFSVTYRDSGGCAPSSVVAAISGIGTLAMSASGSS